MLLTNSAAETIISVSNLEKKFGSFTAVNSISFNIERGKIYGFLGPNGAGKSTTIRMLCGLLVPSGGSGTVAGYDIYRDAEKIKAQIGYMSQKFSLYEDLTVEENIDFYSGIYHVPPSKKKQRKEWIIEMAGLTRHIKSQTGALSGGWKQRLALGCAILHKPKLLFLDEPTSGVDPVNRRRFWNLIYDLSDEGVTIFVTTHYMDEAEYVDDIAFIYKGDLVAKGNPESLKKEIMRDEILEVSVEHIHGAMLAVKAIAGVKEVALFGRDLHLVVNDASHTEHEIRRVLDNPYFVLKHIEKIPPSMEDVFISLIEKKDSEAKR